MAERTHEVTIKHEYPECLTDGDTSCLCFPVTEIACLSPATCAGWVSCSNKECMDREGPWNCDADVECTPWCEREEFEFHGEVHTWVDEGYWTLPYEGCIVAVATDAPIEDLEGKPDGTYELHADYMGDEYWDLRVGDALK